MRSAFVALAFVFPLDTSAKADSFDRWAVHGESDRRIDHSDWGDFLAKYRVPGVGGDSPRVRYGGVSQADRKRLRAYLAALEGESVSKLGRAEQMAYWINLYNAKTVDVVLEAYPVASIRDIRLPGDPLNAGPWDSKVMTVEGVKLSLNDVEHRILRPLWKDARLHFALNCASVGCPDLAAIPYTAANTDSLLEAGATAFLRSRRGAELDRDRLVLTSLFDWYKEDFGTTRENVLRFLARYATTEFGDRLRDFKGALAYKYDWNLNDAPSSP